MGALQDYMAKLNGSDTPKSVVAGPSGMEAPAAERGALANYVAGLGGSFTQAQPQTNMTGTYRQWYTGANTDGVTNGWDTNFQKVFQKGITEAYERGDPYGYFEQDKATGVVTWDNARGKDTTFKFGDVVVDGKKVSNVYDDFDRHTANVMMGEYLIETGARKAELNQAGDVQKAWDEELARLRGNATQMSEVAPRAQAFKENVEHEVETDPDRLAIVAAGTAGGAALGGFFGSVVPVIGTAVGAGVGGVIGGVGAWLNSDSLAYQVARSQEQYKLAAAEGAGIQAAISGIAENTWSIAASPFQNLYRGSYDLLYGGGVGGGAVGGGFEETTETGDRKAGVAWQIGDFGAMIGDAVLQMASYPARLAYQAQMTAQIGTGAAGLLPGVGQWDPVLLKQNSVWTTPVLNPETGQFEERFDAGNALAGIGNVGIDVVQLGAMSGLARGVDRLAATTAKATGVAPTTGRGFFGDRPWERLNLSAEQRAAVKAGAQLETHAGMKFVVKDTGEIVGKARGTLSMLAPSEGLQSLSAKMLARRDAARKAGAYTSEQLYNTAADMALGQRGLTSMLVNAVGEGQEEFAQAILEPMSQDHKIDAEAAMRAAMAGAAAGFGMTAGARLGRPSADLQMYGMARVAWAGQTNGDVLSYEDWKSMDHLAKRTLVKSASGMAKALTDAAYDKIERDRIASTIGSTVEAKRLEDYRRDEAESALRNGTQATDQSSPIVMHESSTFRPEVVATSHNQLHMNQVDHVAGVTVQLDKLGDEIRKADQAAKATPGDTNLQERLADLRNEHVALKGVLEASQTMERTLKAYVVRIDAAFASKDLAGANAQIDELNDTLEAMYDMTDNTYDLVDANGQEVNVTLSDEQVYSFSKAVSRLMTRDPNDSNASWQILMPQVNDVYALRGADGLYAVSQVILTAIRGDYDGDKTRPLHQLVLPDESYVNFRSGANVLGVSAKPEIGSTELESQLSALAMGLWDSSNIPLRNAARKIATDIEADLKDRYHNPGENRTPIRLDVLDEVTAAVQVALRTGGDVRAEVLELMSRKAGRQLTAMGRGQYWRPGMPRLGNEYFWLANMVTRHMSEFQNAYALHTPPQTVVTSPNTAAVRREATTDAKSGRPARGATVGSTIINELPGNNLFRMFQKLHYTLWQTTTKYEGWASDNRSDEYRDLVEFYGRLASGEIAQRLARQAESNKDQIIGQTLAWLEEFAADPVELARLGITKRGNMALLANVKVAQTIYAENPDTHKMELRFTGKEISLGQHLLYLSLQKFRRENQMVFDEDANMKATYNELIDYTKPQTQGDPRSHPGNAEMAFVSIFEGVRMYDIVGADAVQMGVQLTVGQYYRELVSMPVDLRKEQLRALKLGPYSDAESGFTIPFGNAELQDGSVTGLKSLVDSLFSAANSTITQNLTGKDKGKVHGRYADKSDQRGEAIRATFEAVRTYLQRVSPQKSYTADDISRIANEHTDFGRMLMKVIPDEAIPWVFRRQDEDGKVVFASWFYEVWAQPNAELAEMSLFRNLLMDRWYAKKRTLDIDTARGDSSIEKRIAYNDLTSRLHQVMFRLASSSVVEQVQLKAFLTALNDATSVKEFMRYVNTTEGLAMEGAPLLAWMDDVEAFSPERAGGGWSKSLSTPTLLEDINNLRNTAERLVGDLDSSDRRSEADLDTARAIQRWHAHLKDPDNQELVADPADGAEYARFINLLRASAKRRMANGPRAMLQHTSHLVYGMYAPAHAKAQNPTQMAANAALEAQDNAFGFLTTAERILGDLTAHNEDSVAQAPQMLLRDGGTMMTRNGQQVEWGREMTTARTQEEWDLAAVETMLPLMTNKDHHPLMRSVLFDTVVELDSDNVARRKFLMGSTLSEVMKGTTVQDLFNSQRPPNFTESMKFLVKMEQQLRDSQKHLLEQKVTELVIARTSALDHTASFEEIEAMTVRAYMDFADLMQTVGRTVALPGEVDPVVRAHRKLKEAAMVSAIASAYNISPNIINGEMSKLQEVVELEMLEPIRARIEKLAAQVVDPTLSSTDRAATRALIKMEQSVYKEMQAKVKRMFDLNVTQEIVAQYLYSPTADAATRNARQNFLMQYVYERGELIQAAGPTLPTMQAIKNHFRETKANQKTDPLVLPEEAWEELSNVIISVEIQNLLTVAPASKPPPPYPSPLKDGVKGIDKRKFWDHSYSYLFDFLAEDADDGFVQVARQLARDGGKVQQQFGEDDVVDKVKNTLMRKGSLGEWTASIPIQSIESYDLLNGASAVPSVSMHGLLQQRWGATMEATARQTTDTVADATVTLTARDLDWMETGAFHDVEVTAGNGQTYLRPLAMMNNRFADQLTLNYVDTFGQPQTMDLMTDDNVAREWAPAYGVVPAGTRLKEVNISRLNEELERLLKSTQTTGRLNPDQLKEMLDSATVTMRFVNPDAQPAGVAEADPEAGDAIAAAHANSVWHEGTVYYSDGDMGNSLITAFFYGIGGLNPRGQQAALDTRKKGLAGIEDYLRPRAFDVRAMEVVAGTDFSRMLALKTNVLMDTPVSNGDPIDPHFYNAAYKLMKLKHWVEGELNGNTVRWSAEQVIEWQMLNPGKDIFSDLDFPLANARLWKPSDQVLADMMGDTGFGGVTGRALKANVTTELGRTHRYASRWTEQMDQDFPASQTGPVSLTDTDVARQSFVQDLRVSSYTTPQEQTKFQRRIENMQYQRGRALEQRTHDMQRTTFNPAENLVRNMNTAVNWVVAQDVRVNMPNELKALQREHGDVLSKTLWALQQYVTEQQAIIGRNGMSFWIFQEEGLSSKEEGRLIKGDLGGKLNLVPGEIVLLDTAQYQGMDPTVARNLALERIAYFASQNVALMITSSAGTSDLTNELQGLTMEMHGYQRYRNNNGILVPDVLNESSFQNVAAARDRLVVPTAVPLARQRVSLLTADREIEENSMYVPVRPGRKTRFDAIQAVFDLLPFDVHSQFNTANTPEDAQKAFRRLQGLGTEGQAMLRKEATRHLYVIKDGQVTTKLRKGVTSAQVAQEEESFDKAFEKLMVRMPDRVAQNNTQPVVGEEEFGTGDFVVLVNAHTDELLLYRHGYEYPDWASMQRQLRNQTPGDSGMRGIAMYSGERESAATTHKGTVVAVRSSPGRGFRMELEIPVQELGEKIVFEHNGMKYMLTNLPKSFLLPEVPLFGDIEIDGVASLHDVLAKQATGGMLTSFQNAFAFFGIDFTADIKKFFGTESTDQAISLLRQINRLANKQSVEEIYQFQSILAGQDAYLSAINGLLPTLQASNIDISRWASNLQDVSPEAAIARAMIVYLMSPNADVDVILKSSGFYVDNPNLPEAASQKMPELFTRAFDLSAPDSPIRVELGRRIEEQLNQGPLRPDGTSDGWHLDVNSWEVEGRVANGRTIRGILQFGEAVATEDNVMLNLMAQERKDKQSISYHQLLMNRIGTGGITRAERGRLDRLEGVLHQDLTDTEQAGIMWHDLTFVDRTTHGPGARWQNRTPAEVRYYNRSLMKYGQYRHTIDFDADVFEADRTDIKNAINSIVGRLGLRPSQEDLVHYWIRQMLYHPAEGKDQLAFSDDLSPKDVLGATRAILGNLDDGYLPTYDSAGPSFFAYPDLQILFEAYRAGRTKFAPYRKEGDKSTILSRDNFGEWIASAYSQALNMGVEFDPMYRLDMSGFMNTYQTVLRNSGYMMDITFDKEYQGRLLDPQSNELLTVTLDPVEQNRLTEQVLLATANLEYDDLMNGAGTADDPNARAKGANWRARRLQARARWRARHKVHPVKVKTDRDFVRNGTELLNRDADMHSLQRIVIALRHGMAMLNPGLYFSMVPEQGFRMYLSEATNALTGESTLRSVGGAQRGVERLVSTATGGRVSLEWNQYTAEQAKAMNNLFSTMGDDGAFTSLIIKDMMWHKPGDSPGRVVKAFEKFASIGNKWQDPTWGTTQKALARHYVEAIIRSIEATPTRNVMTIDSVIAHLRTDPAYFAKEHEDLHLMASNFVVDFRSLKNTPWSLAMKAMYEPWSSSPNTLKRFAGTLLKLQAMYATYNMNVLTTITGMQGYTAMTTAFFDGRKKPNSLMKLWFKARDGERPTDEEIETFDLSTAVDALTIANSFIRGGVTQTGLFLVGMAAGGILSGEDDEAKRRRQLAQALNAHLIMDPRRVETDFRNKDVLFLDWLPPMLSAPFRVQGDDGSQGARAMAQMSWLIKPFLSPILGMERFFMTGDFDYITAGFSDAVSSLPLFNKGKWDDAVRTADELRAMAADEQAVGTPTATKNTMYLLSSAVAMYESMLVENMFVNSLYAGFDTYDRDPTKLVLRDSDGEIQRTIENNARPNDVALTEFVKEDGTIGQGYMKRNPLEAQMAAHTENNFTAAAVMSLFTGGKRAYLRSDMPVKMRTIERPELTEAEARVAIVLATLNGQKAKGTLERRLSLDEVTSILKKEITDAGDWDAYHNLDALALKFYQSKENPVDDPMVYIGPDGREALTKSGHVALFKGLMGGTITLDDPQMKGIAISSDMRKELEKDFYTDMTRQGIDLGLTQKQAESRAKRLMLGPMDDPTILGFRDILWDKRIPWDADVKYKQLNTTYVQGPDGFPWATGFKRGGAPGSGGFASLFGGLKRPEIGMSDAMTQDGRMNSVDLVRGLDTGMRGLVPFNETELIPTDWEQTQKIIDAIKDHDVKLNNYEPNSRDTGSGSGRFYRSGYRGGGGSSKGYSPSIFWSRQPTLPRGTNVYGNTPRNIFWNNANVRRTTIRRERFQSERGRLKQWQ